MTRPRIDRRTIAGKPCMVVAIGKPKPRKTFERALEQRGGYVVAVNRSPRPLGLAAEIADVLKHGPIRFPKEWFV